MLNYDFYYLLNFQQAERSLYSTFHFGLYYALNPLNTFGPIQSEKYLLNYWRLLLCQ